MRQEGVMLVLMKDDDGDGGGVLNRWNGFVYVVIKMVVAATTP